MRLGTVLPVSEALVPAVRAYAAAGFESVSFFVWERCDHADLDGLLEQACEAAVAAGVSVSTFSVYGNPLRDDETGESVRGLWRRLTDAAGRLGVPVVSGFAGRTVGTSVEASVPAWKAFFAPLAERALAQRVCLGFENCRLGDTWKTGKWNLAINPDAWQLMFATLDAENIGLEWEPCHQLEALADPHAQLERWADRVVHVHGKDARVDRQALAARGLYAADRWHHSVLPGQGDSDWARLIACLKARGFTGAIDLENPEPAGRPTEAEIQSLNLLRKFR